jgi:hypothetical protein
MSGKIVSDYQFIWFCTFLTVSVAVVWLFVDSWRLVRTLREDLSSAAVRDRMFGSLTGLAVAVIGIVGMLRYHL